MAQKLKIIFKRNQGSENLITPCAKIYIDISSLPPYQ